MKKNMLRIYLSGPIGPNDNRRPANVRCALEIGSKLIDEGFAVFVPHLYDAMELLCGEKPYETWMDVDMAFLPTCHALVRLPDISPDVDREVGYAEACHIPVFRTTGGSFDDLVRALRATFPGAA